MTTRAKSTGRKHGRRPVHERRADPWRDTPSPVNRLIERLQRLQARAHEEGQDEDELALGEAVRIMRMYFGR